MRNGVFVFLDYCISITQMKMRASKIKILSKYLQKLEE